MLAWVDGRLLVDPEEPAVPVTDHGFTVGDGVFEALKVVDGHPFALTRHLERLTHSARGLGLPAPDLTVVRRAVTEVLSAGGLARARVRITYTGGPAPLGSARGEARPTLAVALAPLPAAAPTATIVTVPWPRNERGALAGLKTTSYAENVVALAYAAERGAGEAVFPNTVGNLCEGTGSNVFYALGGELRTPTLGSGCLAGVTRALLLEWCTVREIDDPLDILEVADEIFLASTTRDVQPVLRCDGRDLGEVGPLTLRAAATWAEREALDPDP